MINDIADVINISVSNPAESEYDIFVGLEHYDVGEPIITRYGSTKMLTTACKKFSAGDILLARRNVYLRRAGLVKFDGLTSGDSIVIRIKPNLSIEGVNSQEISRLLPFVLNTNAFWDFANTNSDGTMSKRLSPQMLLSYEFNLPPYSNQKPLADKLWAAYNLKASKLKLIDAIDEMVKSQFIEMFGGNKVDYVQLSSLCSTFIDGDWIESKDQSESGIRLIQTGNVGCGEYKDKGDKAKYITEDTFNKLHCTEIYPGDILISRLPDPVGRACVLPEGLGKCVTAVDCTIIRFSEKILPNFFVAYTNTPEYLTQIKSTLAGTTRLRVSRGNLGKVKIPVPSIEQQRTFVSIAEQADKSKFELKKSIEAIDKVIKSLINNI